MKKALVFICAAALVLAFTLPVQAAGKYLGKADFSMRGQMWQWGTTQDNTSDFDDDTHDARRFVRQRFRWYFDTSFDGKYGGTVGLEWDWVWGSDASDGGGTGPGGEPRGDDLIEAEAKNAYIWGMIPYTPAKVTAGLGVEPGLDPNNIMFASNDWFGIRLDVPIIKGMLNTTFAWLKASEGVDPGFTVGIDNDQDGDDSDYYILNITGAPMKWLSGGIYGVWGHARNDGLFSLRSDSGILGGRTTPAFGDGELYWVGLHAKATPGILDLFFHGNYFDGDAQSATGIEPGGAYALFGHIGIRPGPARILARAWYFSGDDDLGDDDWERWQGPDPFFAPSELWYSGYRSWGTGLTGYNGNPGGTAFAGLEVEWDVTKKFHLRFLGGYLWFPEDEDKPADTLVNNDDDIGWEFDIYADYKIYDHLTLTGGFNYLFAGDALDTATNNADDAYEFFWRLYYSF